MPASTLRFRCVCEKSDLALIDSAPPVAIISLMKTTTETETAQRARDGRYTDSLDKICKACGQRKGAHDAEKPYPSEECEGFRAR